MRAGTEYDRKGRTGRVVALHGTGDVVEWGRQSRLGLVCKEEWEWGMLFSKKQKI